MLTERRWYEGTGLHRSSIFFLVPGEADILSWFKTPQLKSTTALMDVILNISRMDFCCAPPPLLKDTERRQQAAGLIHGSGDWLPGAKPQPHLSLGLAGAQLCARPRAQSSSCWRRLSASATVPAALSNDSAWKRAERLERKGSTKKEAKDLTAASSTHPLPQYSQQSRSPECQLAFELPKTGQSPRWLISTNAAAAASKGQFASRLPTSI